MPIMLSASVSFKNCFAHPKVSYIMFWIYYFIFHIYVFNPPENDSMYSVKYEAKVLLKISMDIQLIQHYSLERAFFPHCTAMMNLVTLNTDSLSGFSAMFY